MRSEQALLGSAIRACCAPSSCSKAQRCRDGLFQPMWLRSGDLSRGQGRMLQRRRRPVVELGEMVVNSRAAFTDIVLK